MAKVYIDGQELEIGDDRATQRDSGRQASGRRDSALLLAPGAFGRGQLPHVPGRNGASRSSVGRSRHGAQAGARLPDAGDRRNRLCDRQRESPTGAGDGRRGLADPASHRLSDLRQGGRMSSAGLSFRARAIGTAGGHQAIHQSSPTRWGHGDSVCRSLRDVQSLCPIHARSHRNGRVDGRQSGGSRRN